MSRAAAVRKPRATRVVGPKAPKSVGPRVHRAAFSRFTTGGYEGASGSSRTLAEWSVSDFGPRGDSLGDLPTLRARSLDLERNAPLAGAATDRLLSAVIGEGLEAQPRINRKYLAKLGITDAAATEFEQAAATLFWHFTSRCDIARRNSFNQLALQNFRHVLTGGEGYTIFRYKPRAGDLLGTKLQLFEAARVSQPDAALEDDRFLSGIELDEDGAEVAFHFTNRHPGERYRYGTVQWTRWPAFDETGEPLVLHTFRSKRAGEVRGIPLLAPVIAVLKQLTRYSDSELMATVLSSMFTVFVKNAAGGEGLAAIDSEDENPAPATDYKMGPGAIVDLMGDEEIQIADPKRPNAQFDPFFNAMCKVLGANIGVPFEILVQSFTSSYSASRAALLQFWRTVTGWRSWHVESWHQPVYNRVLREAIAAGLLIAPGYFEDPLARDAWQGVEWTGPQMPEIDRMKAVQAAAEAIKYELSTREREAAQLNGTSWEENHAQLKKEIDAIRKDGTDAAESTTAMRSGTSAASVPSQPSSTETSDDKANPGDESGTDSDDDTETPK